LTKCGFDSGDKFEDYLTDLAEKERIFKEAIQAKYGVKLLVCGFDFKKVRNEHFFHENNEKAIDMKMNELMEMAARTTFNT
jgi:hypothetical protein